jgi:hypothetical protein
MPDAHTWRCPGCIEPFALISSPTVEGLEAATLNHIRSHESIASLQAVDAARIGCQNSACDIGKNKIWDLKQHRWCQKLTDFDKEFLAKAHIAVDDAGSL